MLAPFRVIIRLGVQWGALYVFIRSQGAASHTQRSRSARQAAACPPGDVQGLQAGFRLGAQFTVTCTLLLQAGPSPGLPFVQAQPGLPGCFLGVCRV